MGTWWQVYRVSKRLGTLLLCLLEDGRVRMLTNSDEIA